jgi:C1A family cysteine protease
MHEHHGPVLDQGSIGSCTGFAAVQALNTGPLYAGRVLGAVDGYGLYAQATLLDAWDGAWPGEDTGSSGLAVAKAARRCGLVRGYRHAFGLKHALAALTIAPLIIGIPWYEGMFEPTGDGFLELAGEVAGGHEIAVVGLDYDGEYVVILNSWGPSWGASGRAKLRWTALGRLLSEGGDATILGPPE